ncbi:KOW motif-containing protein [Chondromyces apiculatus]|uniref:TolA protein n=1 Tax=Chondromyces apiculatus DSM 436 TaxID=1192034 RepID=A0A017T8J3_9BACT|nr:KOW motif-containing protein [Chondromyces apiculatus]EYF05558.1 TolA protein [Chondromyces apiculatus DSM 436]
MTSFTLRLTAGDFDAYSPTKATSKAYSRPRMEIKQRVLAWARGMAARLAEHGISVDVHGSDEHPSLRNRYRVDCQWVFFWRDEKARDDLDRLLARGRTISAELDDVSPYRRHAFLALRLAENEVEVCFAVHPDAKVDIENLRARLEAEDSPLPAELSTALHALPEQFTFGAGDERVPCSSATPEAILTALRSAAAGQVPLWIGWSLPRDTALEHADILDEQLEDALAALSPIYRLVAWSRENDHLALDSRLEGIEQERARTHAELEAENERWRAEQTAARERSMEQARVRLDEALPARRPTLETLFRSLGPRPGQGAPANKPTAPRPPGPAGSPGPRRPDDASSGPRKAPGRPAHPAQHAGGRPAPGAPHDRGRERDGRDGRDTHVRDDRFRDRERRDPAPQPGAHAAPSAQPTQSAPPTQPAHDQAGAHTSPAPGAAEPRVHTGGPLDKGASVRVLRGPFEGKLGTIGDLDGKGGARVLLGLLSTRLDLSDLEPVSEAQGRPSPAAPLRKPQGADPRKAR